MEKKKHFYNDHGCCSGHYYVHPDMPFKNLFCKLNRKGEFAIFQFIFTIFESDSDFLQFFLSNKII